MVSMVDLVETLYKGKKPCDYPAIENGKLSESLEYHKNYYFPASVGQHVDYHCVDGYSTPSGYHWVRIVCSGRGWFPEPKCLSKYISTMQPENGYFSQSWKKRTFQLQKEVSYRCLTGFVTPEGQETGVIRCQENGWTPPPKCIKSCKTSHLDILTHHTNKTVFMPEDIIEYGCLEGYQTADKMPTGTTRCGINGEWSPTPQCLGEYYCEPPPEIANGSIAGGSVQQYRHGDRKQYECNTEFKLVGSQEIECIDGQWSSPPSCIGYLSNTNHLKYIIAIV
uniref:Sushi domain-containing protein n=1 Tax=Otus sunia TaxID=257818 RepID=A0A8C8AES6_9STRI